MTGTGDRRVLTAAYVGLALTVVATLAVVIGNDALLRHLHEVEDGWIAPDKVAVTHSVVATYLYALGGLGVVSWLLIAWMVKTGKRGTRVVAVTLLLLGGGIAVMNLLMEEYGRRVLPTLLGVAGVLPCLAGLAVVVLLWRPRRVAVAA
ncbi:hypothetical protein ACFWY9_32370 [Amycolatopsis sp. NPDC059027]|uniref:hypothetical protein n=1 Tax=Amycolatopsis sp. NPDC059027 TaxID=3346709 RepID=UPI00366E3C4E